MVTTRPVPKHGVDILLSADVHVDLRGSLQRGVGKHCPDIDSIICDLNNR